MSTLRERLLPSPSGDRARHVRRVIENPGANIVGNPADFADRMGEEIEASTDSDQFGAMPGDELS
jgi:hypothetical protein